MSYPIPDSVLARHIAVVGETGSGKTHDAKSIVEHLVDQGHRVCVLDTIKSDWWGVISSSTGKRAGLPFRIIGGPRGHVPLHAGAGSPIGELVAKGKLPLTIIDMADFKAGGHQQFFEDFAEAVWKHIKGVLYLVIEEAHEIAPKERAGFGKENMSVYWAKRLATGSRSKGIRLIVATQRVQALHNAVLGSCGALAAHTLSFPADQKPVIDWLNATVRDKATRSVIEDEMASLPTGTAWVTCPKEGFIEKVHFPAIKTFDNSATPEKDAADIDVATATVDQDELRAIIGDAVKEAEANDPAVLRSQVDRLKAEVSSLERSLERAKSAPPMNPVNQVPDLEAVRSIVSDEMDAVIDRVHKQIGLKAAEQMKGILEAIKTAEGKLSYWVSQLESKHEWEVEYFSKESMKAMEKMPMVAPKLKPQAEWPKPSKPVQVVGNGSLSGPEVRILNAIAWLESLGVESPEQPAVAFLAGYTYGGGAYNNPRGRLNVQGFVEYVPGERIRLTEGGRSVAQVPDIPATNEALHEAVLSRLPGPEQRLLRPLLKSYPKPMDNGSLADAAGYTAGAGAFNNPRGRLKTLGLIEYPQPGIVRARDLLFPEG